MVRISSYVSRLYMQIMKTLYILHFFLTNDFNECVYQFFLDVALLTETLSTNTAITINAAN